MPRISLPVSILSSVLVLLFSLLVSQSTNTILVSAATKLTVTIYTTSRDCTGTSRTASYASGLCVSAAGSSMSYSCNSTGALVRAYSHSRTCDSSENEPFDAKIGLDQCSPISGSSSWRFECGGFCLLPKMGMIGVVMLVIVLMMFV